MHRGSASTELKNDVLLFNSVCRFFRETDTSVQPEKSGLYLQDRCSFLGIKS